MNETKMDATFLAENIAEAKPLRWMQVPATVITDHVHCIICIRPISPRTDVATYRADARFLCTDCFSRYLAN